MLKLILPISLLLLCPSSIWYLTSLIILLRLISLPRLIPLSNILAPISQIITTDILSATLILLSIWITSLILLVRYNIFINKYSYNLFIPITLTLLITLLIAFASSNLILFYIIFEASLVPTLLLIIIWGYQPERLQARIYIIIYTIIARLPLLFNIINIYIYTPHLNIFLFNWMTYSLLPPILWWVSCLIAFIVKLPLYSTHLWLPKAHVEAPVAGSIILAAILLKLGGYGIIRLSSITIQITHKLSIIFSPLALWGAILTRLICLRQSDLKALIAYSSIAHIGIIISATITNSTWAWNASLTIILAHGICSSALFSLANITYEKTNTRRAILTKGLILIAPTIRIWWFIFTAANIAAPPFINLLREIILISSLIAISPLFIIPISLLRFFATAYSLHLYTLAQHGHLPRFINPSSPYSELNLINNTIHFIPLLILIIKADLIVTWLWPYSWINNIKLQL